MEHLYKEVEQFWRNTDSVRSKQAAHWSGSGKYRSLNKWMRIVRQVSATWTLLKERNFPEDTIKSIVEYGCGGGAVLTAMSAFCKNLSAIDISMGSLTIADQQLRTIGINDLKTLCIDIRAPEAAIAAGKHSLFVSVAVFQHLPDRGYARRVLRIARRLVFDKGLAFIQFREGPKGDMKRQYSKCLSAWNCLSAEEFDEDATAAGWDVAEIYPNRKTKTGYKWAIMKGV